MSLDRGLGVAFRGRLGRFDLDASFTGPSRGVTALFGPSGCGKTSVLRAIAGLNRFAEGYCAVGGEVWQDGRRFLPTHARPIGYVFQEPSLFPHLSVRRNLLYGASGSAPEALDFDEAVTLLSLEGLLDRAPAKLSGGERQRVAIGRALLSRPRLMLMDEPLSALDRAAKDEILPFLERLCNRLSIPVILVSHDMSEVEKLADHLVLMQHGRVTASGPLGTLQSDAGLPLAGSREAAVSLDAVIEAYDVAYGLMTLAVAGGRFLVPAPAAQVGEARRLRIAAGDVSLTRDRPARTTIVNTLPARILEATTSAGPEITVVLGLGPEGHGARLLSRITRRSWDQLGLSPGTDLYAQVKGAALVPGSRELG